MKLRKTRLGRRHGLLAVVVAMMLGLTACGMGSGSGSDDKTLTLWHMEQPPNRVKAFQKLIDQYNATNPDYKVKQQVQDWNQIYSKIAGAVQSKTQPDILFTIPDFTTYVRPLGSVRPVTGLVNKLDKEHGFRDVATEPYHDDGEYWAVPLYGMVQMLWYRKDLLKRAGITSEPKTWDDLLADAKALTKDGKTGIALPAGKNLATDQVIYSFLLTNGAGRFFTKNGDVDFNRPEVVETFAYYRDLMKYSPKGSTNYSWGEPQAAFNSGASAMTVEKGQYLAPFEEEADRPASDLGCAPIPQPTGGQPGSIYYSNAAMVMSDDDAKAKAAEDFLSWLLEPKHYGEFLNAEPGLFLPQTEDGMTAKSWTSNDVITKYRDCVHKMLDQSKSGALFGFVDGQYIDKIGNISGQNILAQVIQKIVVDGDDPASAVAWGEDQMKSAVSH